MRLFRLTPSAAFLLLVAVLVGGCGGGGTGTPGSTGGSDTGMVLSATVLPVYNGKNTSSVDAFQDNCGTAAAPVSEIFLTHQATVTIIARRINQLSTVSNVLTIERYVVTYTRSNSSIGAPPIEFLEGFITVPIASPTGDGTTTVTFTVNFVDLVQKQQYASNMTSGRYSPPYPYINNYTATYTFYGKDQYGSQFSAVAQTDFEIGDFNNCQ